MNSHDCREGLTAFGWMVLLVLIVLTVALWGPEWLGTHSVKQPEAQPLPRVAMLPTGGAEDTNIPPAYTETNEVRALNFDQMWVTNKGLLSFGETTYPYLSANNGKDEFTLKLCPTNATEQTLIFMNRVGLWFNAPTGFCLLTTNVVWQDGKVSER